LCTLIVRNSMTKLMRTCGKTPSNCITIRLLKECRQIMAFFMRFVRIGCLLIIKRIGNGIS
jgi:hypothetical protein